MGQGHAKLGLGHSYSYGYRLASGTWAKAKAGHSYRLASGTWAKAKAGRPELARVQHSSSQILHHTCEAQLQILYA